MDEQSATATATTAIREAARELVKPLMRMHQAVAGLNHPETKDECLKALHRLTVELETVKKLAGKLERADDSTQL